jgi:imidazolonepropionase-like amidohydrolase
MNLNFLPASLSIWATACAFVATAVAQDVVAVKGGKILPVGAPAIDDGTVLIQNGRITKLGKTSEVEIPWAAKVVDATGKTVMPTWVLAHSQAGQRGFNENMQNVPWLSVADAVDPAAIWFEDCLRNGVGTVHVLAGNQTLLGGLGMVVRPFGRTVEDMAVASNTGMKLSLFAAGGGRLQQIRKLRRALADLREYLADFDRRKAEFDKEKAAGAVAADKNWTEEIDRTKKAGVDLVQKKLKGWLYVPSFAEMDEAMRLTQDLDLQLVLGPNMDEAIAMLTRLSKPVVLDETIEYFETDEETQKETKRCPAKQLADAGIPFATSLAMGGPGAYPWWQIGTLMRNGVSRDKAIESLTTVPAKMLGLDGQVGSLAEGKLGNVQILTGDPLAATSWVETVILEGTVVYERKNDPRLQYLFQVEQDKAKKAGGPDVPAGSAPASNTPTPPKEGPKGDAPKTDKPAGTGTPGEGK